MSNLLKKRYILPVIAILIVGSAMAWYATMHSNNSQDSDTSQSTANNSETSETTSDQQTDSDNSKETSQSVAKDPATHTPKQNENSGEPVDSNTLTGVINYKAVNSGNLVIRNTIDQLVSSGTCTLTLRNASTNKTVVKSAPIASGPTSSSCQGFNIPTAELGSGSWSINLSVVSGSKHGTMTSNVEI